MAAPRGRSGGRSGRNQGRSGGYADRGRGGDRGSPDRGRGGYSSRGGSSRNGGGGANPAVLLGVIGGGAVIVIVLLVVLLNRGGDVPQHQTNQDTVVQTTPDAAGGGKRAPRPLTDDERRQVHDLVMRLAGREREVKDLKRKGFEAQDRQDYEEAQRQWRQAYEILTSMIDESNALFVRIGEERVEYYASADYEATGEWPILKAEFQKYVK